MIRRKVFLLSVISGILLSLPWLFPGLGWILLFAFLPLLIAGNLLQKRDEQRNSSFFYSALIAFLIWNFASCWWVGYVSVIGMMLIVILNAIFMASVWCAANMIRKQFGQISGYFSLLVFWITFEFLQYHWTIQWPWLNLGNGLANSVKIIQWYEFTGVLGGSLWILLSNFLIFLFVKHLLKKSFLKASKFAVYALLLIGIPNGLSFYLYAKHAEKGAVLEVAVLQPNIDPYTEKFSGMSELEQICRLDSLAGSISTESTDLIVAPETSLPEMWEDSFVIPDSFEPTFTEILSRHPNVSIVAGAITKRKLSRNETISETARKSTDGSFYYDSYNSALLFDRTSKIQISQKSILVSGVEKMPFQKYFAFLDKFILNLGGSSGSLASAEEPTVFTTKNGIRIGTVICFESAFGEYCTKLVKKGAGLLVMITNDGWWRDSPGCWQHFGYSRIRAIETRRSIVRSANTGISGFINSRGDVLKKSEVNTCSALSFSIPLNTEITFYTLYGDVLGWMCSFLTGLTVFFFSVKKWGQIGK
jgi:apolipoprotein N-acyltransferase